jgi:hypothetical protein
LSKDNFPSLGGEGAEPGSGLLKTEPNTDTEEVLKKADTSDVKNMLTSENVARKISSENAARKVSEIVPEVKEVIKQASPVKVKPAEPIVEKVVEKVPEVQASPVKVKPAEPEVQTPTEAPIPEPKSRLLIAPEDASNLQEGSKSEIEGSAYDGPTITGATNLDEETEEDPNCPPSARPNMIRYTKSQIIAFIEKDVNQNLPDRMTELMRMLITDRKNNFRPKNPTNKYGPGAGYQNKADPNFSMSKGGGYQKHTQKPGGNNWKGKDKAYGDSRMPGVDQMAQRKIYTEAEKAKISEIENNMGDFMEKSKNVDVKKKRPRT